MNRTIGNNFYMRANIQNPDKIFVDVGLGLFLELNHSEALEFIDKRKKLLEKKTEILTEESTKIKANIKLVIHGLRELQGLKSEDLNKPIYDPLQ